MLGAGGPSLTEFRRSRCVETSSLEPAQACSVVRGWRLAAVVLVALAGCKTKPGDSCRPGTAECLDRATELACQTGKYIAAPCKGPDGCTQKASVITCDVSANAAGDVCSTDDEGKGACGADLKTQVICRAGKYEVHPCRGPAGCKPTASGSDCDLSLGEEGDPCAAGEVCSVDRRTLLTCREGKFVPSARCRGPDGCKDLGNNQLVCDISLALEDDPCASAGGACSVDRKSLLRCKDGKFVLDSRCRGPEGCSNRDGELTCDMSTAEPGDPCESGSACTSDAKSLLTCKDGRFIVTSSCPGKGCSVVGDSIRCGGS